MAPLNIELDYSNLPDAFFSELTPPVWQDPRLYALNADLASSLGAELQWLKSDDGLSLLSGGSAPSLAMAYGGHQFGHWSGMLGDGRARLVADLKGADGFRHELHLKGSGRTPYSRGGDGMATLGSCIREYIVSESMAALGVPTTRSLSIIVTGETIQRNGLEPAAILCRSARSHLRVGTFQFASSLGDRDALSALADFAIDRLYPDAPNSGPERYAHFLRCVVKKQAELIAQWMGFGFIHGVMNTDNVCVSGETIDYGPCAFMDRFHPARVFSSIDRRGRYAWNRQPEIGHWNLARLAETLFPLLGDDEDSQQIRAEAELNVFIDHFQNAFNTILADKFGLSVEVPDFDKFIASSIKAMAVGEVDFTVFFRALTRVAGGEPIALLTEQFNDKDIATSWIENWKSLVQYSDGLSSTTVEKMSAANPVRIARNHRVEQAIQDANSGDKATFERLHAALKLPFSSDPEFDEFEKAPIPEEIVHETFCGT